MKFSFDKVGKFRRMLLIIVGLLIISFAVFISAQSQDDESLKAELAQLEGELGAGGYDWLVNYSGDDLEQEAQIEVYEKDGEEVIATFTNIKSGGLYRVLLSSLSKGESYETFDLKNRIKIPYDIFQKKKRIEEIKRLIENG